MSLQCYNKGCGQKFDLEGNTGESCQYHSGEPVFHEGKKKWSCCEKWSTDFTEFLSFKGCTKGLHSNVKPEQPEKPAAREDDIPGPPPKIPEPLPKTEKVRPDASEPKIPLKVTVTSSAKAALEKKLAAMELNEGATENGDSESFIRPGASCKHNGCQATYTTLDSEKNNKCVFHPGYPVFHEGCKFWSCCNIKKTDFSDFLKQEGCATGEHVWNTRADERRKQVECRYDHFQTGSAVTINVYAKAPVPDSCIVKVNQVACDVDIAFEGGECNYKREFVLAGTIDPSKSGVKVAGTKVEITLKKAEFASWKGLEL